MIEGKLVSLGVSICLDRHWQRAGLDNRDIKIKISRFSLDGHLQIQYFLVEIETYQDLSRFLWFLWISWFFSQPRNNGFLQISQSRFYFPSLFFYILCFKIGFNMGKKCRKLKFFQKVSTKIMVIFIYLDDLDKNLNTAKSRLKSLDFKKFWSRHDGQSWRFSKVGLDRSRNLDLDWSRLSRPPGLKIRQTSRLVDFWKYYYPRLPF